jgi:hypothetical protein
MYNVPDGSGLSFTGAYQLGPVITNATIQVTIISVAGVPIAGIPASDIWVESSMGNLALCGYAYPPGTWPGYVSIADGPTGPLGTTTFSNVVFGGGCTNGGGMTERCIVMTTWGKISGTGPVGPPNSNLKIRFNSPDMDGDGSVNLTDVIIFAPMYWAGGSYCCDFFWDGACNLSDIVILAGAMTASCP